MEANSSPRWTSTIVALPIVLYTSYVLYERSELSILLSLPIIPYPDNFPKIPSVESCPCPGILTNILSLREPSPQKDPPADTPSNTAPAGSVNYSVAIERTCLTEALPSP